MEQEIAIRKGLVHVRKSLPAVIEDLKNCLSMSTRDYLSELCSESLECDKLITKYEERIVAFAKKDEVCKRIQKIPGAGAITTTAIVAHAVASMWRLSRLPAKQQE